MHVLEKEGINPSKLGLLLYIKLNSQKNEFIQNIIKEYCYDFETESGESVIDILVKSDLIKFTKTVIKSRPWESVRLSDKGEKILKSLSEKPINDLAQYTMDYVKSEYQRIGADKKYISGGDKLLFYISEFLDSRTVQYDERMIKAVITSYCDSFPNGDLKYLNKMSNLFYKPVNAYSTKFSVEDSPICKYIESSQDNIRYYYKKLK